ncbi:putative acetyltransferase [Phyllobacterium sp. YR620]|jgi:putative acetyltransferase|uniref:GNAT family N-acetyltransferase n=1 Tax=Phyllobacterium pellucidum TaxID=2740464 RepID=A0A849VNP6_9HYPH|nr:MULTISPECIES: GNAT family N-acetyltransferase [Phyllobacterium]NTS29740.1 GNAT family N-acetyltransferase [Phyllobacterium pellucidum]UGY08381.1 GNAT family N-acetyltransferase [Phyllobacterium sp. T1018]SDP61286.1 putative acetyltransferase [Phyllobacterium sp. YR620]SFJ11124.1 putative acetyltransferase [Phyllobacterium sp. CL33Tsu]
MAISIAIETPLQDDVRSLVADLNAHLLPLSPVEFQFKMTVEEMAGADTTVFVARDESGFAIGCGALKEHADGLGEIKRMFTRPTVRGQRVGSALLEAITAVAVERGVTHLVLETGVGPGFDAAWRLYQRAGFTRCGVVLDYPDSEHSAFYEKRLALTPAQ